MRRVLLALCVLIFATTAFSKEVFFPIAGSTSGLATFKTDVRLFNPSSAKDIQVQAFLLPVGNRDNSGAAAARTLTVNKRQMLVLNDVVSSLGGSDLDAIRLVSSDDFIATERVYAVQSPTSSCNIAGTVGQDVPALEQSAAKRQGVLLQLRTTFGNCGQNGVNSFRTNIGAVNPNSSPANVTFRLYDKNNALVATGRSITVPPLGVVAPTNMVSGFFFTPGAGDLSEAWVSFTSDQPLFTYASVVDNCTSDATSIPMAEDSVSTTAGTREIYFPIGGSTSSVGTFKTDVRLFNPSTTKDITVQGYVLSAGNHDNTSAAAHDITVPRRQMIVLNDAVAALGGTDLAAIRFTSSDDFVATERVYSPQTTTAQCNVAGTVGQDVPSLTDSAAKKQGVLVHLKTTTGNCSQAGVSSFRTNIGALNPNTTPANVTFKLYDKSNTLVATGSAIPVAPLGVIAPTNMVSGFFFTPGAADLSDAWVTYSSDKPLMAYASVVDSCTSDATFVPMGEDTDSGTSSSGAKAFTATLRSWAIDLNGPTTSLSLGDQLSFTITNTANIQHGFELQDPGGDKLISIPAINPGQTVTRTVTVGREGTYSYYCVIPTCGNAAQHAQMFGSFTIGKETDPNPHY